MDNKILKRIIILLVILLLIALVTVMALNHFNKNQESAETLNEEEMGDNVLENYGKDENGKIDEQSYFDIKTCMQNYLDYINMNNSQYFVQDEEGNYVRIDQNEIKQKIYNLLSNKFITEKNITIENLYNNIKVLEKNAIFVPLEARLIQDGEIKSFLVHGLVESINGYTVLDKMYAIVNINVVEGNFSIEPISGNYNSIKEVKIGSLENTITSNANNNFKMAYIQREDLPKEYVNVFKRLALGAPEELYKLLDEKYKNAKFRTLEEFKEYIKENKAEIISARLAKYQVINNEENGFRYICIDQHDNYYIIKQKSILQDYDLILDIYSIDIPEFVEKYNKAEEKEKILLNIQKAFQAIDAGDYRYVYEKLDDTYKSNYFKTQEELEKYIKEKWYKNNKVEYGTYEKNGDVYVYNIRISDEDNTLAEKINIKVVMKLLEGTEFVMSFSVE